MMCGEAACARPVRARGVCEMHYGRMKRAGLGELQRATPRQPSTLERLAQEGRNRQCVGCGDLPLFGGMRCLRCFRLRCDERSSYGARIA
jgi:hypothetical protein